jgi:two-component system sensor histidine kinase PrrB
VRSLRGRLTLGITLVLAVVIAGAGVMVSRYVERSERRALDERLKATAELSRETALASVQQALPSNDRRLDQVLSASGTSLRLLLGRRVLLESGRTPAGDRPAPRDGLRTFVAGSERYRSYVSRLEQADLGGLARLEVTASLGGLEDRQAALNRRLAAFGAGGAAHRRCRRLVRREPPPAPAAPPARGVREHRRDRGSRPPRPRRRRRRRAAVARRELQRHARAARPLGRRP